MADEVRDPHVGILRTEILGTAQEWLRSITVPNVTYGVGEDLMRVRWMDDGTVGLSDDRYGELKHHYRVTVIVEPVDNWRPGTWREVATLMAGPIALEEVWVRLSGVEATVTSAMVVNFHVDPKSNTYRPTALEHEVTNVRLVGRDQLYTFPPDSAVEILSPPMGEAVQAIVDKLGAELVTP